MENTVLLVVDMQTALVEGHPYNEKAVVNNIKRLLALCRKKQIEVVYVRHDGGAGDELEYGSRGWQIYEELAPIDGEKIFDKKYNSAFKSTGLKEYLDKRGVTEIILAGMQSEYCIDATCKAAFEYGYKLMIAEETTTTYDNGPFDAKALYKFYMQNIWKDRFAKIVKIQELEQG